MEKVLRVKPRLDTFFALLSSFWAGSMVDIDTNLVIFRQSGPDLFSSTLLTVVSAEVFLESGLETDLAAPQDLGEREL